VADNSIDAGPGAPKTRRRTRRPRGDAVDTRARLISAATELGATGSFFTITIDDIAAKAGTSRATFYLYFENKDDIYLELAREMTRRFVAVIESAGSAGSLRGTIDHAVRLYVTTFGQEAAILKVVYSVALNDQRFGDLMNTIRQRCHARTAEALEAAQDAGYVRAIDLGPSARALVAMVESFCIRQALRRQEEGMDFGVDRTTKTLSDLVFHAIAQNPRSGRSSRRRTSTSA